MPQLHFLYQSAVLQYYGKLSIFRFNSDLIHVAHFYLPLLLEHRSIRHVFNFI